MQDRRYYSTRTGKNPDAARFNLATLKRLFLAIYGDLVARERLQEMLGKDCVDAQEPPIGSAGHDVGAYVLRRIRKDGLWPVPDCLPTYSEDDLFDMIEFLYDHISKGLDGWHHSHAGCGMHYETFDREAARLEYRVAVNEILRDYESGFELTQGGEIIHLPESGFANLLATGLPSADPANIDARVRSAIQRYLRRGSGLDDRREAVRGLADVLEYLRPKLKDVLASNDEADLFNIANNFAVRHHNDRQRTQYDPNIWTSWMFYFYLATIHAAQRLISRGQAGRRT